jgi:hypothetical protein
MAAKTWETDFRFPAIQVSLRMLGDAYGLEPFQFRGSFCIPVAERPVVGWTPGRVSLIAIVVGLGLLGVGGLLAWLADGAVVLAVATCCSLSGILTFVAPLKLDRYIVSWLIGNRRNALVHQSDIVGVMAAELSDADRSRMRLSIDGDDHVLIFFDAKERRLMIEGIGARYQIRAADVEELVPFEFMSYLGVEIAYRIDPQTRLRAAIARSSLLLELTRQLPFLFALRKRIPNKLFANCQRTLQLGTSESG